MNDLVLSRLVRALDAAVESGAPAADELHGDLDVAALRLRCLRQRLGDGLAEESPYLSFLRRTTGGRSATGGARMAASA
jgi:hypothetical protein